MKQEKFEDKKSTTGVDNMDENHNSNGFQNKDSSDTKTTTTNTTHHITQSTEIFSNDGNSHSNWRIQRIIIVKLFKNAQKFLFQPTIPLL